MKSQAFTLIGLTGGIASGKSTVSKILQAKGFPVMDADQISRELSQPGGAAHPLIELRFGTADRSELRKIVFSDPQARTDLEKILHPLIAEESMKKASALANASGHKRAIIFYEAALLVETGRYRHLDALLLVESSVPTRIARLMARDRISEDMAHRMVSSQASDQERRAAATWTISNDRDEVDLDAEISVLIPKIEAAFRLD